MAKTYRAGVIGFAHMHVNELMRVFAELPNVEWVACADTRPQQPELVIGQGLASSRRVRGRPRGCGCGIGSSARHNAAGAMPVASLYRTRAVQSQAPSGQAPAARPHMKGDAPVTNATTSPQRPGKAPPTANRQTMPPPQTRSRFPFRWCGMKPTVSGKSQLDEPPEPHCVQEKALDASELRYANPRG